MRDINREIEVVESIIKVLNRCLEVHKDAKQPKQISDCENDILKCQQELQKLINERLLMLI
jgi:hypothetical protein